MTAIERQLSSVLASAAESQVDAGLNWYRNAHAQCVEAAQRLGVEPEHFIGAVAALSPGLRWELNVQQAEQLARAVLANRPIPIVGTYGRRNAIKAVSCLKGADPLSLFSERTSPKVRAFYSCLVAPESATDVVIDRHAYAAAYGLVGERGGSPDQRITPKRYSTVAAAYRKLAESAKLLPHQIQAVVWCAWRDQLQEAA